MTQLSVSANAVALVTAALVNRPHATVYLYLFREIDLVLKSLIVDACC